MNCLKPALMALDMKMFVMRAKESVQSLANFLATYVEDYPSFVEVLERIKILVGDSIIGKVHYQLDIIKNQPLGGATKQ